MYRSKSGARAVSPAMEPYYGRVKTNDFIVGNLPFIGQAAPLVRERMRTMHGRYLSGVEGFSGDSISGGTGSDPAYESEALDELESQDDVFGSGIFDQFGRGATANSDAGVFASHYGLPGFVAREVPFTVSGDITDATDDAQVVMVPGGGMTSGEAHGMMVMPKPIARQKMVVPMQYKTRGVPAQTAQKLVPMPVQRVLGSKSIVAPQDMRVPVNAFGAIASGRVQSSSVALPRSNPMVTLHDLPLETAHLLAGLANGILGPSSGNSESYIVNTLKNSSAFISNATNILGNFWNRIPIEFRTSVNYSRNLWGWSIPPRQTAVRLFSEFITSNFAGNVDVPGTPNGMSYSGAKQVLEIPMSNSKSALGLSIPYAGFGADPSAEESTPPWKMAVWGLLLGAAVGGVVVLVKR